MGQGGLGRNWCLLKPTQFWINYTPFVSKAESSDRPSKHHYLRFALVMNAVEEDLLSQFSKLSITEKSTFFR